MKKLVVGGFTAEEAAAALKNFSKALKQDGRGKHGKQGRKKSERPLKKVTIRLFEDQLPISDEAIRKAVDYMEKYNLWETP